MEFELNFQAEEFKSICFVWTGIGRKIVTCIKSRWWDKLFLMWVHACEQRRLVHYVKAGVNLTNMRHLFWLLQDKLQKVCVDDIHCSCSIFRDDIKRHILPFSYPDKIASFILP